MLLRAYRWHNNAGTLAVMKAAELLADGYEDKKVLES